MSRVSKMTKINFPNLVKVYSNLPNFDFKDPILGLRQFLAAERLLKMMKDTFYFMLKAFFVLKIFHS